MTTAPASRRAGGDARRRRASRQSVRWRVVLRVLVAAIMLALILTVTWPASDLGSAEFLMVDGTPVMVGPGTTVAQVADVRHVAPGPGAKLDVAGDVIVLGGGSPGTVEVDSSVAALDLTLHDGSVITTRRGSDHSERLVRKTAAIPHESRTEGGGVVVALVQKGSDGEREAFVGDTTERKVAEFVTREPVDAVLRRSPGVAAGQKAVALTFDDGPSTFTPQILAVLAEKGISATFFWVGNVAAGRPEMIGAARSAGHEVENHSWSHADLTKLSPEAIGSEISRAGQTLGGTRFLRPPYGAYDTTVAEQADALGQRLVLWDVDTLDWKIREASSIVSRVQAAVRPGAVILMHDGGGDRSQTVAALPALIDWLLNEGYALTTVQHLSI